MNQGLGVLILVEHILVMVPRLVRRLLCLLARRLGFDLLARLLELLLDEVFLHESIIALMLLQLGSRLMHLLALDRLGHGSRSGRRSGADDTVEMNQGLGVLILVEHILVMVPRLVRRLLCLLARRLGFDLLARLL